MRPLRVLFVQDHLGQTMGLVHGVTRYLVSTLPAFDRAAVEPVLCVLTPRHPLGAPMLEAEGIEPVFLAREKWDPRAVLDLIRLVRERHIDVVHVSGFKAPCSGGSPRWWPDALWWPTSTMPGRCLFGCA
jgi:hypothetical protein